MIFNNGGLPIETADLISPPRLVISNAEILAVEFKQEAKEGTGLDLVTNFPNNTIPLTWRILEKGDKPILQIFYAGKPDAPIKMEGRIKEQDAIVSLSWEAATKNKIKETFKLLCLAAITWGFIYLMTRVDKIISHVKGWCGVLLVILALFAIAGGGFFLIVLVNKW